MKGEQSEDVTGSAAKLPPSLIEKVAMATTLMDLATEDDMEGARRAIAVVLRDMITDGGWEDYKTSIENYARENGIEL